MQAIGGNEGNIPDGKAILSTRGLVTCRELSSIKERNVRMFVTIFAGETGSEGKMDSSALERPTCYCQTTID
jgi:hypothetical protein